ncbi:MAG: ATPase [Candidatus Carbobacillus altaicus]|uniref:ATPase n=1 Tax=Candidatus Carbonibacillus altaicus TaxID=2163959 RepID=A0A2R6Y2T7_9BACL|nr:MAG: ATPase [Candidatus Carbobacillus altaicus]
MDRRALIELKGVSYRYPGAARFALQDVTFRVEEGEWVTIVGGNGSGKTTLAWVLSGLVSPQKGRYLLNGEEVTAALSGTVRRTVGMIFQNPEDQIIQATVADDIAFGLEAQGLPAVEIGKRVAWAIARLGLEDVRDREPYRLSGGQKKRLAIAGMVALKPKALVLDEAFAMLDPKARQDMVELVRSLHQEGMTIIEVTHDMEHARRSPRLVALKDGAIVYDGKPGQLFQDVALIRSLRLLPPLATRLLEALRNAGIEIRDRDIRDAFFERESEGIRALWRSSLMR